MKHPGRKAFYTVLFLCLTFALTAPSSAALPSSSPYRLSFVIQPSDILAGSSLFATIVLTHPVKNLISNNAVQFQVFDQYDKPVPGTSLLPITTDSRGLAIFADTVLQPGKGYKLIASCGQAVIRSRPFDVIAAGPTTPPVSAPADAAQDCDPSASACPVVLPPVTTVKAAAPLPKAKESQPIVIPNPNPGTAQESVIPFVACPEPLMPMAMPEPMPIRAATDQVIPVRILPTSFDLVVTAPPGVPQDLEIRIIAVPNPTLQPSLERYPY